MKFTSEMSWFPGVWATLVKFGAPIENSQEDVVVGSKVKQARCWTIFFLIGEAEHIRIGSCCCNHLQTTCQLLSLGRA